MTPSTHFYSDRIINATVTGPLVRLELGAYVAGPDESAKPALHPTQTMVMPLDGLLASLGLLDSLVKRLVADGVIKPRSASGATSAEPKA